MPNLQTDPSVIDQNRQGGPLSNLSLPDLLSLVQKSRDLQTQSAISDALKGNTDASGQPNYPGAMQSLLKSPAYVNPQQTQAMTEAQRSQFALNTKQMTTAADGLSSLIGLPGKSIPASEFDRIAPILVRAGVPQDMVESISNRATDPNGNIDKSQLVTLRNYITGGVALPTTDVRQPSGGLQAIPSAQQNYSAAGAMPPGSPATGTAPGYTKELPTGATESSAAMQEDLRRASTYSQNVFPLQRALELAQKLGPGGMGPGTKGRQQFEEYVYSLMPQLVPASEQTKIKNYAELEKYLVNNTQQRAQMFGPHTNDGLATAVTGSPNVHINDLAGVDLIKAQLALSKMEQAQTMMAAKSGGPNYNLAKSTMAPQFDPRAFHIENMDPADIAKLQKTLKGPERARFNASLRAGIDSGVIKPPGQ